LGTGRRPAGCGQFGPSRFTNDTDFGALLAESGGRIDKEYLVKLRGRVASEDASRFEEGLLLDGRKTRPAVCEILETGQNATLLHVILHEGRNRQIRRMFDLLGHPVESLHRARVGPIRLRGLAPGRTRTLTHSERSAVIGSISTIERYRKTHP
jgi:pseudouridine synthase